MQTQTATPRLSPFKEITVKQLEQIIQEEENKFIKLQERIMKNLKDSRREKAVGGDHNADTTTPITPYSDPNMLLAEGLIKKVIACKEAIERIKHDPDPWECQECGASLKIKDLKRRPWASRHRECQAEFEEDKKKTEELLKKESTYKRRRS